MFTQCQHLLYNRKKLYSLGVESALPRKSEQVVDNPVHAAGFAHQLRQLVASLRHSDRIVYQLAVSHDRGQWIVEFMGDTRQQLSQSCELFRPHQLGMQRLQLDG